MPKKGPHQEKRLSPAFVSSNPPPGKYGDGNGLMLVVEPSGSKRWVQRVVINGKRRDIGHGSLQLVSLKEAREKALAARKLAREGGDLLSERRRDQGIATFEQLARKVHEFKLPTWKNANMGTSGLAR